MDKPDDQFSPILEWAGLLGYTPRPREGATAIHTHYLYM